MKKIILCSGSPRRRELLAEMDLEFTLDTDSSYVEDFAALKAAGLSPEDICAELSLGKSRCFHRPLEEDEVLLTADTLVFMDDKILGKPHSEAEARDMLSMLSGRSHCVTTCLTLRTTEKTIQRLSTAIVHFSEIPADAIDYYISRYQPLDKAGAYGIQEWIGLHYVSGIKGSFYTIMGLNTADLSDALKNL